MTIAVGHGSNNGLLVLNQVMIGSMVSVHLDKVFVRPLGALVP